jgi:hypothetical protein
VANLQVNNASALRGAKSGFLPDRPQARKTSGLPNNQKRKTKDKREEKEKRKTKNHAPRTTRRRPTAACPYCAGRRIIRKGVHKNKYGDVQFFYCSYCKKKFTPLVTRHKSFFASSAESVGTKLAQIAEGMFVSMNLDGNF